jgi:hypothetical protein
MSYAGSISDDVQFRQKRPPGLWSPGKKNVGCVETLSNIVVYLPVR